MNTSEYYDSQYNARASVSNTEKHLRDWASRGKQARQSLPGVLDLKYGPTEPENLDLFWCLQPDAPLFVFIHGGYWRALHKNDFCWVAEAFIKRGINVAVVNYDLVPKINLEQLVLQVSKSIAWLYDHAQELDFNPDKIFVGGHSAGGHLTAMMMCTLWKELRSDLPRNIVKGGVAISGLFDLDPISKAPFLNVDLKLDEQRALAMSPAYMPVSHGQMPLILCVGEQESDEFHRQSELLKQKWGSGISVSSIQATGRNHFTVCSALAEPDHPLFLACLRLMSQD